MDFSRLRQKGFCYDVEIGVSSTKVMINLSSARVSPRQRPFVLENEVYFSKVPEKNNGAV